MTTTTCTDCDYCGKIRNVSSDGYGGKICKSCRARVSEAAERASVRLIAVEITRDENEDGEQKWLVTPVYRRHGRLCTVPDDRGWDTIEEAMAEADALKQSAKERGTYEQPEQL